MRDEEGAAGLISKTRLLLLFLVAGSVLSFVFVVADAVLNLAPAFGGLDAILARVGDFPSEQSLPVVGLLVFVLLFVVVVFLVPVVAMVRLLGKAFDERVHVRVTDAGVGVEREGSRYWQSSGVDVPFDAITAVEYADPDEPSYRVELGDWWAPKFFAGRSQDWVRLERGDGSAVYVGSDRPVELAETIARQAPSVEAVEPF